MPRAKSCAQLALVTGVGISVWRSNTPCVALCGVRRIVVGPCDSVCRQHRQSRHPRHALPDGADLLQYLLEMPEDIAGQLQHVADATIPAGSWFEAHAAVPDLRLMPPAFADAGVAAMPPLEPDVKYLYGADGEVLRDMTNGRPLQDDWWNQAVGVQASIVRGIDQALRYIGVPQAFGWTILVWTFFVQTPPLPARARQPADSGNDADAESQG